MSDAALHDAHVQAFELYGRDHTTLVKRCISAMAYQFNAGDVQVDPKVFNAARIWRLPGTIAAKGDPNCPDAPHRRAEILEASAVRVICPREALVRLSALAPAEGQTRPDQPGHVRC